MIDSLWAVMMLLAVLLAVLGLGLWVALALFVVAAVGIASFTTAPAVQLMGTIAWNAVDSWSLVALPLFILMGELLVRTRIAERLFTGLTPWLARLPGGLLHINVVASTLFAAVSGSSAATAATIGKITIPELLGRGYDSRLVVGSIGGAGTLGFLVPPSLIMIIYGVLAEVSIGQLFLAGILPGLLLAGGFMTYLALAAMLRPSLAPRMSERFTLGDRLRGLVALLATGLLIAAVLGSIYSGIATPTESAAIGVAGAVVLGICYRTLSFSALGEALMGAVKTTSMIGLIVAAASLLSTAMGYIGIPQALAETIGTWGLGPMALIITVALLYLLLGLFLDGISMVVITLPVTLPLVTQAGFDPLWYGIFLVLMVEAAQITPPVGFNLFVIQGISRLPIGYVARSTLPFFLVLMLLAVLVTVFPELVIAFG